VCKSDAEDVANIMNIFEELKEDEVITFGPCDGPSRFFPIYLEIIVKKENFISPRKKVHFNRAWTTEDKSTLDDENICGKTFIQYQQFT